MWRYSDLTDVGRKCQPLYLSKMVNSAYFFLCSQLLRKLSLPVICWSTADSSPLSLNHHQKGGKNLSEGHIVDVIKKPKGCPKMAIFGPNNSCTSTSFPKAQFREQQIMHGLKPRILESASKGSFWEITSLALTGCLLKVMEKDQKFGFHHFSNSGLFSCFYKELTQIRICI